MYNEISQIDTAFTPNQYHFILDENTINALGPIYVTSNSTPTSSNPLFQVESSGLIFLKVITPLDYENIAFRRLTTVITESPTDIASLVICLTDLNDNSPTQPTPDAITISVVTTYLAANNTIIKFTSTDADSNQNGFVLYRIVSTTTSAANFTLTSSGVLENTNSLPPDEYCIVVEAFDTGSPSLSSFTTFALTISRNTRKESNSTSLIKVTIILSI